MVVFTHGFTGTFTDYTFIFEDLASRGYVVASVDHTYEATAVEFPDGRFVKSVLGSHWDNTWRTDQQTLSSAVAVRLGDLRFVVDELERLNSEADSPFAGKLDTGRLAVAGHSLGGMAVLPSLLQDTRFKAGVLIDGWPDTLTTPTQTPVLILAAGHEQWSDGERGLWNNLRGPRMVVNLEGAEHVTPSDLVWLAKGGIKTGAMGAEKTIAALRDYIAAFLDANLRGEPMGPLLTGPSPDYPDVLMSLDDQLPADEPRTDAFGGLCRDPIRGQADGIGLLEERAFQRSREPTIDRRATSTSSSQLSFRSNTVGHSSFHWQYRGRRRKEAARTGELGLAFGRTSR